MPAWVTQGYEEYARRLPSQCALRLVEIAPGYRGKGEGPQRAIEQEASKILKAIPASAHVVALDAGGCQWDTAGFARRLGEWLEGGRDVALLVGGPDGLSDRCRQRAEVVWSLSKLTLPHPLVRVVVAEQLYRAWSVLQGHPYHRE